MRVAKEDHILQESHSLKTNKIGRIYKIFRLLANNNINVDGYCARLEIYCKKIYPLLIKEHDLEETLEIFYMNMQATDDRRN